MKSLVYDGLYGKDLNKLERKANGGTTDHGRDLTGRMITNSLQGVRPILPSHRFG